MCEKTALNHPGGSRITMISIITLIMNEKNDHDGAGGFNNERWRHTSTEQQLQKEAAGKEQKEQRSSSL